MNEEASLIDVATVAEKVKRTYWQLKAAEEKLRESTREVLRVKETLHEFLLDLGALPPMPRKVIELELRAGDGISLLTFQCIGIKPLWVYTSGQRERFAREFDLEPDNVDEFVQAAKEWIDGNIPRRARKADKMVVFLREWIRRRLVAEERGTESNQEISDES